MITALLKKISFIIFTLTSLSFDLHAENQTATTSGKAIFLPMELEIDIEIARNQVERELGLMHRTSLESKHGMLFVYPDSALREVWMKNTLIPLDVLFLSQDGYIVSMLMNLQPCTFDPCQIYNSETSAMYMLELNSHFTDKYRIKIGQRLLIPQIKTLEN